ncbi:MAG: hypothetical protein J6K14_06200 [Clostridia bacterium]|nr:hypothetical protein [Clostridia bacterium]
MSKLDVYVLFLCITVFAIFTVLFSIMITYILRSSVRLIRVGAEDAMVQKEGEKMKKHPYGERSALGRIFSIALCVILTVIFAFSIFLSCTEDRYKDSLSTLKVVKTSSMERRNPLNKYLEANGLDNQIGTFDLIVTHPLPGEMELELYDIVVYEVDGMLIIHRIVEIEEPNAKHPGIRHFKLQGDSISAPDRYPVLYEQMRAIYRDERVPFVGSLIAFLQSPAGWLCILLAFFVIIITPIAEKKLGKEILARYEILLNAPAEEVSEPKERIVEVEKEKIVEIEKEKIVERLHIKCAPVYVTRKEPDVTVSRAPLVVEPVESLVKLHVHYPPAESGEGKTVPKYVGMNIAGKNAVYRASRPAPKEEIKVENKEEVNIEAQAPVEDTQARERAEQLRRTLAEKRAELRTAQPEAEAVSVAEQMLEETLVPVAVVAAEEVLPIAPAEETAPSEAVLPEAEEEEEILVDRFGHIRSRSFAEKREMLSDKMRARYEAVDAHIEAYKPIRVTEGKKYRTYKSGRAPIAKMAIRGKTLSVYLPLDPKEYEESKYVFTDEGESAAFEKYPMRLRLSSERQTRWAKELVDEVASREELKKK